MLPRRSRLQQPTEVVLGEKDENVSCWSRWNPGWLLDVTGPGRPGATTGVPSPRTRQGASRAACRPFRGMSIALASGSSGRAGFQRFT